MNRAGWLLLVAACGRPAAAPMPDALVIDGPSPPSPRIVNVTTGSFDGTAALTIPPSAPGNLLVGVFTAPMQVTLDGAEMHATSGSFTPWVPAQTDCGAYAELDVQRFPGQLSSDVVTMSVTPRVPFTLTVFELAGVALARTTGTLVTPMDATAGTPDVGMSDGMIGVAALATCGTLAGLVEPTTWMLAAPDIAVAVGAAGAPAWQLTGPARSETFAVKFGAPP